MIVIRPFEGEMISVTEDELYDINAIFDNSAANWTKPSYVVDLFQAANSSNGKWVYLRSEGWHQLEKDGSDSYLHVTVHLNGWTYHCYTKVSGPGERPSSKTHKIDCISYKAGKSNSSFLYPA